MTTRTIVLSDELNKKLNDGKYPYESASELIRFLLMKYFTQEAAKKMTPEEEAEATDLLVKKKEIEARLKVLFHEYD